MKCSMHQLAFVLMIKFICMEIAVSVDEHAQ